MENSQSTSTFIQSLMKSAICLLAWCSFSFSLAATEKVVSIASLEDYAPLVYLANSGATAGTLAPGKHSENVMGYSWDLLRESYHTMGYTIQYVIVPWARAMSFVKQGQVDILFPTGKNAQRQQVFHYSRQPVNQVKYVLYVQQNSPLIWRGLDSLKNLTIGLKRGFNYGADWQNPEHINTFEVGKIPNGFQMLSKGHIHGFLGYEMNWDHVIRQNNWQHKYKKLATLGTSREYLVALKSNPKSLELLRAYDDGINKLQQSGRLKQLKQKWFIPQTTDH